MSSSRSIAAMASLPHTRFDGALGTGRSISLPMASFWRGDESSMKSSPRIVCRTRRHSAAWDKARFLPALREESALRPKIVPESEKDLEIMYLARIWLPSAGEWQRNSPARDGLIDLLA